MRNNCIAIFIAFSIYLFTLFFQSLYLNHRYPARIINPECPWCEETEGEDVIYLPIQTAYMRVVSPADSHFLADILWMRTTYYFGKHALSDREYPHLFQLLDIITDLSPKWTIPYLFGAVMLPAEADSVEDGLYFIEKGIIHNPDIWHLWFFKGYYLWKEENNIQEASQVLYQASLLPDAPPYLANLSATLLSKEGQKELAVRYLYQAMEQVKDTRQKEIIRKKIKKLINND